MLAPTVDYDGMRLWVSPGAKRSVLWIHGYTLDHTIWEELWAVLPGWRHVGVDLPGHGRSRPIRHEDTLPGLGRTLARLAAEYDISHLVGMSFGGMIAMQTAIESPRSFTSLTLGSPALGGGPTDTEAATKNLQLIQLYRNKGPGPWLRELWMQWPPGIFNSAVENPSLWNALIKVVAGHSWSELQDTRMERLASHSQLSQLATIRCPTLVLLGEDDMAAFKRCAELVHRAVPKCRRTYLAATGHLSLLEHSHEVAPLLAAHWSESERSVPETCQRWSV
jgi:pimeloyl-ACP methyl ester carboxylesterase